MPVLKTTGRCNIGKSRISRKCEEKEEKPCINTCISSPLTLLNQFKPMKYSRGICPESESYRGGQGQLKTPGRNLNFTTYLALFAARNLRETSTESFKNIIECTESFRRLSV